MSLPENRTYLGDGVYIQVVSGQIAMTVENGIEITDVIYVDTQILKSALAYAEQMGAV